MFKKMKGFGRASTVFDGRLRTVNYGPTLDRYGADDLTSSIELSWLDLPVLYRDRWLMLAGGLTPHSGGRWPFR